MVILGWIFCQGEAAVHIIRRVKMRKTISLMLICLMLVTLFTGCGGKALLKAANLPQVLQNRQAAPMPLKTHPLKIKLRNQRPVIHQMAFTKSPEKNWKTFIMP